MVSVDLENIADNPQWEDKRGCDSCDVVFKEGDHVVSYFSDWVWNEVSDGKIPVVIPQGMYCLDCYEDEIPIPMKGVTEGFIFDTITYDERNGTYSVLRRKILRGSPSYEGIEWDPFEVTDRIFRAPADAILKDATPYSIFTLFYRSGIDLRGFVKDGKMKIPDEAAEKSKLLIEHRLRHHRHTGLQAEPL